MKIFWSWQSDTHQPSNRYFVRDVLGELAKTLNGVDGTEESDRPVSTDVDDVDEDVEDAEDFVSIDHDTKGLGGSPRIAERILEKIAAAAVFVADVTPVAKALSGKHIPNPNVMIELGYALRVLGEDRIVLVGNKAFDAKLSRLPFDLRHRSAPAFYTLREDTSEERKAEVAAELMDDLRDRIKPGLKLALKQVREDTRRTKRAPELSVVIEQESDAALVISQTPMRTGLKTLDEVKAKNPTLRLPRSALGASAQGIIASQRRFSGLGMGGRTREPSQWTAEETEQYNRRVKQHYAHYEAYLAEHDEHIKLLLRTFQIRLAVDNSGTAPATGIDVDIYFPDCVVLRDHNEAPPVAPEAPQPPAKTITDDDKNYGRVVAVRQLWSDLISPHLSERHTTLIYPDERRVHFSQVVLKHNHLAPLEPVIIRLAREQDIASFDAEYVITANEPIDPIRGAIHFKIRLSDGQATT